MIRELSLRIDSKDMKYRVMNIPRTQRMFLRSLSEAIRRTNQPSTLHSTTGQKTEH